MKSGLWALFLSCWLFPNLTWAVEITLDRPGDREFVRDQAHLLKPDDLREIRSRCDKLLSDKATPILVITIERMADHGGQGMRIETFARLLFDQWEVGHAQLNGQPWNTGILLLVSKGDRKARIELGNGWRREKDALCERIMQEQILPQFRQGDYSAGIKAGVNSLDAMARELPLPAASRDHRSQASSPLVIAIVIGLVAFTVISLTRSGSRGWAYLFWGAVLAVVGTVIYTLLTSHSRNSSDSDSFGGGSFGGGSFGGGYSGGGGASGSW